MQLASVTPTIPTGANPWGRSTRLPDNSISNYGHVIVVERHAIRPVPAETALVSASELPADITVVSS